MTGLSMWLTSAIGRGPPRTRSEVLLRACARGGYLQICETLHLPNFG